MSGIWNSFIGYANAAFDFLLQGNSPQEVVPVFLIGIIILIGYIFVRLARGDTA